MRVCVTKSAQSAGKLILGVGLVLDGEGQKCQNSVCDLDLYLENEINVQSK